MKTTGPVLAAILLLAGLLFTPWSNKKPEGQVSTLDRYNFFAMF